MKCKILSYNTADSLFYLQLFTYSETGKVKSFKSFGVVKDENDTSSSNYYCYHEYNADDSITKSSSYWEGRLFCHTYEYDLNGQLVESKSATNDTVDEYCNYEYMGNRITKMSRYRQGLVDKNFYYYSDTKETVTISHYNADDLLVDYEKKIYDSSANLVGCYYYDSYDSLLHYAVIEYDGFKRVTQYAEYYLYDNLCSLELIKKSKYNSLGSITEYFEYRPRDKHGFLEVFKYDARNCQTNCDLYVFDVDTVHSASIYEYDEKCRKTISYFYYMGKLNCYEVYQYTEVAALNNVWSTDEVNADLSVTCFDYTLEVTYNVTANGLIRLTLCDLQGNRVKVLLNKYLAVGKYSGSYNLSILSKGLYVLVLNVEGHVITHKIIVK